MKKIKRILAMIMAFVMIMGMSTMAFAEDTATITVLDKVDETITATNAQLSYLQVIEPDTTSATGWKFSRPATATAYKKAFDIPDNTASDIDEQTVIAMMIRSGYPVDMDDKDWPEGTPSIIIGADSATAEQINKALENVMTNEASAFVEDTDNVYEVNKAGVYAIKAVESGYTYKAMAAYVGFGIAVDNKGTEDKADDTKEYPVLENATLYTKKIPTTITKDDNDGNDVVEIGQEVTYTIETAFPYFNKNDQNKIFKISDVITGAEYKDLATTATVTIGGNSVTVNFVEDDANDSFEVDLTSFIDDDNSKAGQKVVVTYTAVIDDVDPVNTATSHIFDTETDSDPVELFTGQITLIKYAEDYENGDATTFEDNAKLANAKFKVYKNVTIKNDAQEDVTVKKWAQFDDSYKFSAWVDDISLATPVVTGTNGELTVQGLDLGTYYFKEIEAPQGYSINETDVWAELKLADNETVAEDIVEAGTYMIDTRLLALPSTGGIGTTIFTVAGCAIMIAAAGFFFASRKKEEE